MGGPIIINSYFFLFASELRRTIRLISDLPWYRATVGGSGAGQAGALCHLTPLTLSADGDKINNDYSPSYQSNLKQTSPTFLESSAQHNYFVGEVGAERAAVRMLGFLYRNEDGEVDGALQDAADSACALVNYIQAMHSGTI